MIRKELLDFRYDFKRRSNNQNIINVQTKDHIIILDDFGIDTLVMTIDGETKRKNDSINFFMTSFMFLL